MLILFNATAGQLMWLQGLLAFGSFELFALLVACFGVGAIAGNVSAARWGLGRRILLAGLCASAIGLGSLYWLLARLASGFTEAGLASLGAGLLLGISFGAAAWGWGAAVVVQSVRFLVVVSAPEGWRGRASALFQVVGRTSLMLSSIFLGALALLLGGNLVVVGVCLATLVLASVPLFAKLGWGARVR